MKNLSTRGSIGLAVAVCAAVSGLSAPAGDAVAAARWQQTINRPPPPPPPPPAAAPNPAPAPAPVAEVPPPAPQACGRVPLTRTITVEVAPPPPTVAAPPPPPTTVTRRVGGGGARWAQTLTYTNTVENTPPPPPPPPAPTYRTETITEYVDIPCPTGPGSLSLLGAADLNTNAVPVPSVVGLLGVGGLALWMSKRRRRTD